MTASLHPPGCHPNGVYWCLPNFLSTMQRCNTTLFEYIFTQGCHSSQSPGYMVFEYIYNSCVDFHPSFFITSSLEPKAISQIILHVRDSELLYFIWSWSSWLAIPNDLVRSDSCLYFLQTVTIAISFPFHVVMFFNSS